MSRPTDVERGALIARETAIHWLHPDLFGLQPEFDAMAWEIFHAANDQLADCRALRAAQCRAGE